MPALALAILVVAVPVVAQAAPTAPTYTAPTSLKVGVAITPMNPSGGTNINAYSATGLPSGLSINSSTGVIDGTPDTANANTATATVTVSDTSNDTDTVDITFPAVTCADPVPDPIAGYINDFECQQHRTVSDVTIVDNPNKSGANTSDKVGQFTDSAEPFGATIIDFGAAIDLSSRNQLGIKVRVPVAGPVRAKLEGGTSTAFETPSINVSQVGTWVDLTFDFSSQAAANHTKIALFFNFGVTTGGTDIYQIDDIRLLARPTWALSLDTIAGDDTINIAEKAAGFNITGDTGSEGGVSVTVTVGTTDLTATSASADPATWSVSVPAAATYIAGTSVTVKVNAAKTGFTDPSEVTRTLTVDLTAPTAPTYTAPTSLKVGTAIAQMSPSGGSGIDEYSATGLPSGLSINTSTGAIDGTPDTANASTTTATVTVRDTAANTDTVDITFPAVTCADPVPDPIAGYINDFECQQHRTVSDVTIVDNPNKSGVNTSDKVGQFIDSAEAFGATIIDFGAAIDLSSRNRLGIKVRVPVAGPVRAKLEGGTSTAFETPSINVTQVGTWVDLTFDFSSQAAENHTKIALFFNFGVTTGGTDVYQIDDIRLFALPTLPLNLDTIAGDDTINIAEKAAGFNITGDTGSEGGVSVTVTVGTTDLTATSASADPATWSVSVPAAATYIAGTSVAVAVNASKTGFTDPSEVARTLTVDLTAPTAPTYTAPTSLKVGTAITRMSPSGGTGIDEYSATGLPSGLSINGSTGAIDGTPDTANASTATATVTVSDTADNTDTVDITFPAVTCADPVSDPIPGYITDFECRQHRTVSDVTIVDNPDRSGANTSDKVGQFIDSAEAFGATVIDFGAAIDLSSRDRLGIKVRAPVAGPVVAKLEGGTSPAFETPPVDVTQVGTWVELTFDFSSQATENHTKIALFFNFGVTTGGTDVYQIDDIRLFAATTHDTTPSCPDPDPWIINDFECQQNQTVPGVLIGSNPIKMVPNVSANVGWFVDSAEAFGATVIDFGSAMDLSSRNQLGIKVRVPVAGPVVAKLEGGTSASFESPPVNVTQAGLWVDLTFDFSSQAAENHTKIALFFNFGIANSGEDVYQIDDIRWKCAVDANIIDDFDCRRNRTIRGVSVVDNPDRTGINPTAKVGQFTDSSDAFGALTIDFRSPINLATFNQFELKVRSPIEGPLVVKLEGGTSAEFESTGVTVGLDRNWQQVSFDFSNQATETHTRIALFFNFGVATGGTDVYQIDDIRFFAATTPEDTLVPMLSEATVDGTRLVLTYNEDLDTDSVPGAEAFGVEADSTTVTVSGVTINGNAVTLTLGEPVAHGQTVELDYTVPKGSDARPIQDAAGNVAPALTNHAVSNRTPDSTPSCPDPAPDPIPGYINDFECQQHRTVSDVTVVDNPDRSGANTSEKVGQFTDSAEEFGATFIDFGAAIDLSSRDQLGLKVRVPVAGPVVAKLEGGASTAFESPPVEVTQVGTWVELTFDFSSQAAANHTKIALFFNFGVANDGTDVYQIDDVRLFAQPKLALNLDTIAGDDTINIAEKAAGFTISGDTGSEGGASVTVTVGTMELTATSASADPATWSVSVPAAASYITGTSVAVAVNASKTGYTDASEVTRTLTVDLTAPTAPTYTAPASLRAGVAIARMSPSGGSGVDEYSATGLPSGLEIDATDGDIEGAPDTVTASAAEATVTVSDAAGNTDTVAVTFPAVTCADPAPDPIPGYINDFECQQHRTVSDVTVVDNPDRSGANTSEKVGQFTDSAEEFGATFIDFGAAIDLSSRDQLGLKVRVPVAGPVVAKLEGGASTAFESPPVEVTQVGTWVELTFDFSSQAAANHTKIALFFNFGVANDGTDVYQIDDVRLFAQPKLALNLDTIAGDDTINIAEKAAGFTISGDTGSEGGASVTVTVGTMELTATSASADPATWSVSVPAAASYITGTSVAVAVNASKTGYTDASEVTRTLTVDLTAPTAPTYTAPASLRAGVAIARMSPSGGSGVDEYSATGLPSGLEIDATDGDIEGAPDTVTASAAEATVTVSDAAGNTDTVAVTFPAVTCADPAPDPIPGYINDFECQQHRTVSDVTVVDNPDRSGANTSEKVGQFTDSAEEFGATFIDFGAAIDLSSRDQLGLKVRVPVAGPVVAKLEGGASTAFESPPVEVTQVGTWVELTFDFSSQAAANHTKIALFFNFGVANDGTDVYQIDDVRLFAQPKLALNLDTIAGDDTINIAEKAAGFTISGDTGSEGGASVTVTVGTMELTATSASADPATWSVSVPAAASYITGTSVAVAVNASKTGYTDASEVTRTLTVDLTAPTAPTYTAPASLRAGVAIARMSPSGGSGVDEYSATGLPSGLEIDATDGDIEGAPDTVSASVAEATVTVSDAAGNTDTVAVTFPAVTCADPAPDPIPGYINDFECQQHRTVSDVTVVDNPDRSGANTSEKVGQFTDSAEEFGATFIDFGAAIDLSSRDQLGLKVRVPVAGPVVAKLEGGASTAFESPPVEVTQVGTWVELTFDFSSQAAANHTKIALFFNFGVANDGTDVYQIDDVRLFAQPKLALNLDTIAGDDTINIAEKAAGFTISGDTGSEGGASVTVTVGTMELTATSASADPATWSVSVPAAASYITGTSVAVAVNASKTGYTDASEVTRTLTVDLTAPTAPTYTAPASLRAGVAIARMSPSGGSGVDEYSATGLPSGLEIDATDGDIEGAPDTVSASVAEATVTVSDAAGNTDTVAVTFPAVTCADPAPDPIPGYINDFECQQHRTVSDVTVVDNPDRSGANTSEKVGQFTDSAEEFGATFIDFGAAIDLSSRDQLGLKVRVPVAGPVVAKLEGGASTAFESPPVEVTQVGTWVELTFDFSSQAAANHTKIALFFNFGVANDGTDVYQIDDVRLFAATTPSDRLAPMLSEAAVDGASLVLTYNEDLDTHSVPGAEAFGVEADSTTVTVSDVAINGNAVTLTLGEPVAHGQTVELDYTAPTGLDARPIQDAAGNDATALTSRTVINRTLTQLEVQFGSASYTAIEGGSAATITVSLDQAPHRPVDIPIDATPSRGDFTVMPSVTIAAGITETTVQLLALQDDDASDELVTLRFGTLPGNVSEGSISRTDVKIEDDDTPAIVLHPAETSLTLNSGQTKTYQVRLSSKPTGPVIVTVSSASTSVAQLSKSGARPTGAVDLEFDADNWNVAQTVTVVGAEGRSDSRTRLVHRASGADYEGVTGVEIELSVQTLSALLFGSEGELIPTRTVSSRAMETSDEPVPNAFQTFDRVYDIDIQGVDPPLTICLSTTSETDKWIYQSYDGGAWSPLISQYSSELDGQTYVCGTATQFSLFALGARDMQAPQLLSIEGLPEYLERNSTVTVTFVFDEPVEGFDIARDMRVSNGVIENLQMETGTRGSRYTARLSARSEGGANGSRLDLELHSRSVTDYSGNAGPLEPVAWTVELEYVTEHARATALKTGLSVFGRSLALDALELVGERMALGREGQRPDNRLQLSSGLSDLANLVGGVAFGEVACDSHDGMGAENSGLMETSIEFIPSGEKKATTESSETIDPVSDDLTVSSEATASHDDARVLEAGIERRREIRRGTTCGAMSAFGHAPSSQRSRLSGLMTLVERAFQLPSGLSISGGSRGAGKTVSSGWMMSDYTGSRLGTAFDDIGEKPVTAGPFGNLTPEITAFSPGNSGGLLPQRSSYDLSFDLSRFSLRQLLARESFDLQLNPGDEQGNGARTIWGRGSVSGFEGIPEEGSEHSGNLVSAYLGMDQKVTGDTLVGVSLGQSWGGLDYTENEAGQGELELKLTSVFPYLHWEASERLSVWGILGAGQGEIELSDEEVLDVNSDVEMRLAGLGARSGIVSRGSSELSIKAESFGIRLQSDSVPFLPAVTADSWGTRLALEQRTRWTSGVWGTWMPSVELAARWDGGDSQEGLGAELAGGISYVHSQLGLNVQGRGRYLLAHQADEFEEWGASLTVQLDPGIPERGLRIEFSPRWGNALSNVDALWDSARLVQQLSSKRMTSSPTMAMNTVAAYSLELGERGLLTTFGRLNILDSGNRGEQIGGRLRFLGDDDQNFGVEFYSSSERNYFDDVSYQRTVLLGRFQRWYGSGWMRVGLTLVGQLQSEVDGSLNYSLNFYVRSGTK